MLVDHLAVSHPFSVCTRLYLVSVASSGTGHVNHWGVKGPGHLHAVSIMNFLHALFVIVVNKLFAHR